MPLLTLINSLANLTVHLENEVTKMCYQLATTGNCRRSGRRSFDVGSKSIFRIL